MSKKELEKKAAGVDEKVELNLDDLSDVAGGAAVMEKKRKIDPLRSPLNTKNPMQIKSDLASTPRPSVVPKKSVGLKKPGLTDDK